MTKHFRFHKLSLFSGHSNCNYSCMIFSWNNSILFFPGFQRSHFRYSFGVHLRHWQRKQTLHQLAQGCWYQIISCWGAWQASSKTIDSWLTPSICSCNKKAGTIKIYKCLIKKVALEHVIFRTIGNYKTCLIQFYDKNFREIIWLTAAKFCCCITVCKSLSW